MGRLSLALIHHPCVDKHGEIYSTSVTNLDVHDIARASKTYGVERFYVVHPVQAQQALVAAIAHFWDEGKGRARNRNRGEALATVAVVSTTEDAIASETAACGGTRPRVVSTSARPDANAIAFPTLRRDLEAGADVLLLFGTGYGLADSVLSLAEQRLAPLVGPTDYNHLSVRAAVAIVLDRLRAVA
jgi:hypothetical protein